MCCLLFVLDSRKSVALRNLWEKSRIKQKPTSLRISGGGSGKSWLILVPRCLASRARTHVWTTHTTTQCVGLHAEFHEPRLHPNQGDGNRYGVQGCAVSDR